MKKLIAARWRYPVAAVAMGTVMVLLLSLGSHANLTTAALAMVLAGCLICKNVLDPR